MDPNLEEGEIQIQQLHKRVKVNEELPQDQGWIVVKKKQAPLSVSISDLQKIARYYSHKSIQNYLRFLMVQSVPNPMWLSIRRQSLISQIIYIDLQIENNLFESMLEEKQLAFLATIANSTNKATFKTSHTIFREDLWENILCFESQQRIQSSISIQEMPKSLTEELYQKYIPFILTPQDLKLHLYPIKGLPIYKDYYVSSKIAQNKPELKNTILVIDCEMVMSAFGYELARATIINFQGETLFDELFLPDFPVTDYNTQYSGITKEMLSSITNTRQNKLYPFLQGLFCPNTILIGQSLQNDLRAMKLMHQRIIDTSVLFMRKNGIKIRLKTLTEQILKRKIQRGQHDSVEDCLAALHLARIKIQNNEGISKRDYGLLRELSSIHKSVSVIDYAIDYGMREYNANHYQKIDQLQKSENILKRVKKYIKNGVAVPNLILTRIQKPAGIEWQDYYKEFDRAFQSLYSELPQKTLLFINCQINPNIQIITSESSLKPQSSTRSPCFVFGV